MKGLATISNASGTGLIAAAVITEVSLFLHLPVVEP